MIGQKGMETDISLSKRLRITHKLLMSDSQVFHIDKIHKMELIPLVYFSC